MKYFKLRHNGIDFKEVGSYPQLEKLIFLGDYEKAEVSGYRNSIQENWRIPELEFGDKAKRTSLLSSCISSIVFLIFDFNSIDFLMNFKIGKHQTWPIKVHYKNEVLSDYLLFHISHPMDKVIVNYAESEFLIGKLGDWKDPSVRNPVKVDSYENYLSLLEVLKETTDKSQIRCNKLVFDFKNTDLDMFRLIDVPFGNGYYVSERLRDAILAQRFTGMMFTPIEEFERRIVITPSPPNTSALPS